MVTEATKRHRELFAGAIVVYLLASVLFDFIGLFVGAEFADNAALRFTEFVSPVSSGLVVLAVLLVTHLGTRTPNARPVTAIALGLLAALLLIGLVSWLAGLTAEFTAGGGSSKVLASVEFLLSFGLMSLAGFFVLTVFRSLPAPLRSTYPDAASTPQQPTQQQATQQQATRQQTTQQQPWTHRAWGPALPAPAREEQPTAAEGQQSWWGETWAQLVDEPRENAGRDSHADSGERPPPGRPT